MIPAPNRRISSPIVELPPFATASSIADMLVGTWSAGDYSSDIKARSLLTPIAFATVTVPLSVLARLSDGMFSVSELIENHSLCGLTGMGMTPANRDQLRQLAVSGKSGFYMPPRLQSWVGPEKWPARTCEKCEREAWLRYGVRALLCPHQIPFVKACFHCGNVLTKRVEGARPPRGAFRTANKHAIQFAQVAQRMAVQASDPDGVRTRLLARLSQLGYVHTDGEFRSTALRRDFSAFCRGAVSDLCLSRLTEYPRRIARLLEWLNSETCTVHPVYAILLDWFLQESNGCATFTRQSKPTLRLAPRPNDWGPYLSGFRDKPHVDGRSRYTISDIPALVAAGCTRTEIGRLVHLGHTSVCRYMTQHGLCELHDRLKRLEARNEARTRWVKMEAKFPELRPYALKLKVPNLFAWLYRRDRNWLRDRMECSEAVGWQSPCERADLRAPKGHYASLAARIRRAAREIRESYPVRWCSLREIVRQSGLPPYAIDKARRQPRIGKLVLDVVETRAQYHARKKTATVAAK